MISITLLPCCQKSTKYEDTIKQMKYQVTADSVCIYDSENHCVVGYMTYKQTSEETIVLDSIEILKPYRNRGYGKSSIFKLFEKYPDISIIRGITFDEALDFYTALNAELSLTCNALELRIYSFAVNRDTLPFNYIG